MHKHIDGRVPKWTLDSLDSFILSSGKYILVLAIASAASTTTTYAFDVEGIMHLSSV